MILPILRLEHKGACHSEITYTSLAGRFLPSTILKYRDVFLAILNGVSY